MNVVLVPVAGGEHDEFFAMVAVYHREMDAYDPGPHFDIATYRRAVLDDMEGRELLWIEAGGERAGFAVVRTLPDWPHETRRVAEVTEFYVVPERRRTEIGRAAVEALLAEHRHRGTALVEAAILRRNERAQAFWAALGFEVQSVVTARVP